MSMTESERLTQRENDEVYSIYLRNALVKRLSEYEDIGTVSEFRELKEKATAKKVVVWADGTEHCPNCDLDNSCIGYGVCIDCGQRLLWD